jgi:hypothetical protein
MARLHEGRERNAQAKRDRDAQAKREKDAAAGDSPNPLRGESEHSRILDAEKNIAIRELAGNMAALDGLHPAS